MSTITKSRRCQQRHGGQQDDAAECVEQVSRTTPKSARETRNHQEAARNRLNQTALKDPLGFRGQPKPPRSLDVGECRDGVRRNPDARGSQDQAE